MPTTALIGAQWGDEGKGKIIDILAAKSDIVVRAQGGNNAGHTVVENDQTYKLHLVPSGILYKDKICIIGAGTVIDPKSLLQELDSLQNRGICVDNLRIDERAHVVFPYHIKIDELSELDRKEESIGTTKKGIGPCYTDKAERIGIRMGDLLEPDFFTKLQFNVNKKNVILDKIYNQEGFDAKQLHDEYKIYASRLEKYICDTGAIIFDAIKKGQKILMEGAQGTLLDLDMGTYPFVTSSHPVTGGFCVGAGIGPTLIDDCIGVSKAYCTRVGKGPFPTELNDDIGNFIRETGMEYGTTTGRPRRCGWLDAVVLRFAVRVNGLNQLAINKLDVLSGLEKLKVCVGYEVDGKIINDFPGSNLVLSSVQPLYQEFDGWKEDISEVKSYDDLPKNAKRYLEFIEKNIGCRVSMIGVGTRRDQNIVR